MSKNPSTTAWLPQALDDLQANASKSALPHLHAHPARRGQAYTHWRLHDAGLLHGVPPSMPQSLRAAVDVAWHNVAHLAPTLPELQVRALAVRALGLTLGLESASTSENTVAEAWNVRAGKVDARAGAAALSTHWVTLLRSVARVARALSVPGHAKRLKAKPIAARAAREHAALTATQKSMARALNKGQGTTLFLFQSWALPGAVVEACLHNVAPEPGLLARVLHVSQPRAMRLLRRAHVAIAAAHALPEWAIPQETLSGRFAGWMQRVVMKNLDAVVLEVRETGELAALLAKAGSGTTLTPEEWSKVREQLLDVVKAVPSLAVFALPGGAVLLPLLLKVLPFDLRPSSFRDTPPRPRAPDGVEGKPT